MKQVLDVYIFTAMLVRAHAPYYKDLQHNWLLMLTCFKGRFFLIQDQRSGKTGCSTVFEFKFSQDSNFTHAVSKTVSNICFPLPVCL